MGFKARIAEVSPFLLIARDARDYPSGSAKSDVPFSVFRSLDAADLMRVHNTVCAERLSEDFGLFWDAIRRQRNVLIHSIAPATAQLLRPHGLIEQILIVSRAMHPGRTWFQHRLDYANNDEMAAAYRVEPEKVYSLVLGEFDLAMHYLPPKSVREHLGLDRRTRTYFCIHCKNDCDEQDWHEEDLGRYAQLQPKGSTSTMVKCLLCARISPVVRERCGRAGCKSNVLSAVPGMDVICLGCGAEQYEPGEAEAAE